MGEDDQAHVGSKLEGVFSQDERADHWYDSVQATAAVPARCGICVVKLLRDKGLKAGG